MTSLTITEQELAACLAMPEAVLMQVKTITHAPLRQLVRHTYREDPQGNLIYRRLEGVLAMLPSTQATAIVQALRPPLLSQGWLASIVALHPLDDARLPPHFDGEGHWIPPAHRLWGLGILPGHDPWDLLSLLDVVYVGIYSKVSRHTIQHTLHAWATALRFDLLGVGRDWVVLAFPFLPQDLEVFAAEVYALCPTILDTWKTSSAMHACVQELQRHNIGGESATQALDAQALRDIAQHLRDTQYLRLWLP